MKRNVALMIKVDNCFLGKNINKKYNIKLL